MSDLTEADGLTTIERQRSVRIQSEETIVQVRDGFITLPIISASEELSTWLDEGHRAMYDQLLDASTGAVRYLSQHLPMMVTYNADHAFPSTCGNKGVGFLPRAEYLDKYIARYRKATEAIKGKPWQDSLKRRVQTAAAFNLNPEVIERRCLVALEVFERQTFRNLQELPLASLLFNDDSLNFINFQVNCAVEVISAGMLTRRKERAVG